MKPIEFIGSSLDDISAFPVDVRRAVGHELWQIQNGLIPSDRKEDIELARRRYRQIGV